MDMLWEDLEEGDEIKYDTKYINTYLNPHYYSRTYKIKNIIHRDKNIIIVIDEGLYQIKPNGRSVILDEIVFEIIKLKDE